MRWALEAPYTTLVVCVLVFCVFAAGTVRLTLSSDTRIFFSEGNQRLSILRDFERKYSQNNTILFALKPREGKITTPAGLQAIADLTAQAWQLPLSTRVEALTNFPRIIADDESFSIRNLLSSSTEVTPDDAQRIERTALADPLVQGRLISSDAQTAGIFVSFNLPDEASEEIRQVNNAVRELRMKFAGEHPEMEIYITGNVLLMGAFAEAAIADMQVLIPVALSVVVLLLVFFIRSTPAVIAISSLLGVSSLMAMGLAGWWNHVVNPATAAAPIVIMTLNMAAAVHVVTIAMRAMTTGMSKEDAIRYSLKANLVPVTLTSSTTLVGFLAMNFAESPPLYTLGNIVAVGIVLAYILTFTWLPAMLKLVPLEAGAQGPTHLMDKLGRFVNRKRVPLIIVMAGVCGLGVLGLTQVRLDDDPMRYFDPRFEFREGADFVEDNLTGVSVIEFDLNAGKPAGVYEPDYQRTVEDFASWLRTQEGVAAVIAIPEITKRIHKAMIPFNPENEHSLIPSNADQISQYFLLYELSLPYGSEITDQINIDRSSSRITIIVRHLTSSGIRSLNSRAEQWLAVHAPRSMVVEGTGINVLFSHLNLDSMRSMIVSTVASIVIIGLIVMVALRSRVLGFLSLGTNLLPAIIGFGAWGLMFQDIGLAASVIAAMTLGIVVDDTIHFLTKYRSARMEGKTIEESIEWVFSTVGVAMLVTTVSMAVGFTTLVLSGFEINRILGVQTAIIISAALLVDWFLLPPLLHLLKKGGVAAGTSTPER